MPFTPEQLRDIFSYHPPDARQVLDYEELRSAAFTLATVIVELTPVCPDQTTAIRKLRECVMTANAAIALRGKF